MRVRDYFVQGRHGWVRLHEKGGKEHEVPCHHNLENFLDAYIAAASLDAPLFQTAVGRTGKLTDKPLWPQDAYRMIQRRANAAGIKTRIGNHTFRGNCVQTPRSGGASIGSPVVAIIGAVPMTFIA